MAKEQPKPRAADVLAGEGSILDKLRKRRIALEQGIGEEDPQPSEEDHRRGYTRAEMDK